MEDKKTRLPHHVIIDNRERMSVTGVIEVGSFDEQSIVCETGQGIMYIKGNGLHIDKLSLENGELSVDGNISSIEYEDHAPAGGGFWSRLFS